MVHPSCAKKTFHPPPPNLQQWLEEQHNLGGRTQEGTPIQDSWSAVGSAAQDKIELKKHVYANEKYAGADSFNANEKSKYVREAPTFGQTARRVEDPETGPL